MMESRRGPFRASTQRMAAVLPTGDTPRGALEQLLTEAVRNPIYAAALVSDAVAALGVDDVPDDPSLLELLVRAYVAPAALKYAPVSAVQAFVDAALARATPSSTARLRLRDW